MASLQNRCKCKYARNRRLLDDQKLIDRTNIKVCVFFCFFCLFFFGGENVALPSALQPRSGVLRTQKLRTCLFGNAVFRGSPFKAWGRSEFNYACFTKCQTQSFFLSKFYPPGPLTFIFFQHISRSLFWVHTGGEKKDQKTHERLNRTLFWFDETRQNAKGL